MFGVVIKTGPDSYCAAYWIDYDLHQSSFTMRAAPVFPFLTKEGALDAFQEFKNAAYPSNKMIHSARLYDFQPGLNPFEDINLTAKINP